MFEAVIFDCDGVLVDSEILSLRVELTALEEIGLPFERDAYVAAFMGMHDDHFYAEIARLYREAHGEELRSEFFDSLTARRRATHSELQVVPGAADAAKTVALPRAVASSSRAEALERKLRHTELWDLFAPHVYSADYVAQGKPAPDIFLYTAKKMVVAPDRCLVIEDSLFGVQAARAAGMTVWGFLGGQHVTDGHSQRMASEAVDGMAGDMQELARMLKTAGVG